MDVFVIGLTKNKKLVCQAAGTSGKTEPDILAGAIEMCVHHGWDLWITPVTLPDNTNARISDFDDSKNDLLHESKRLLDFGKPGERWEAATCIFTLPDDAGLKKLLAVCDKIVEHYDSRTHLQYRFARLLRRIPELGALENCTDENKITEARGMLRDILSSAS